MADKRKILITDDEPDVLAYLSTFFEDEGFQVVKATNGKECVAQAKKEKPDLITLDITMPEESGVRAFRDLQDEETTKAIPIVIITGVSPEFKKFIETRKQVEPPTAYFEKPVDRSALLAKVKEILKMK